MSQTNLDRLGGSVPTEPILPDAGRARGRSAEAGAFDNHLWRVRTQQTTAAGSADLARSSPPQAPPAEGLRQPDDAAYSSEDRRRDDSDDRVEVNSGENAAAAPPAADADDDRNAAPRAEEETNDGAAAQSAEETSSSGSEKQTDAKAAADKAAAGDSQKTQEKARANRTSAAAEAALAKSDAAAADSEAEEDRSADGANAKDQENADSLAALASAEQTAVLDAADATGSADPSADAATDAAAVAAAAWRNARGQRAEAADRRDLHGRGGRPNESPEKQPTSPTPNVEAGRAIQAKLVDGPQEASEGQPVRSGRGPSTNQAAATLAAPTDADAKASPPTTSNDAAAQILAEKTLITAEEAVRPTTTATSDGQLNMAPRVTSARASGEAPTPELPKTGASPQIDRGRFVQRVAKAFSALGKQDGSVRLRLSPPELGSLRLEIAVRNGQMTARVEAETTTARNLLLDNLPALRDRLSQQDIRIKTFDVQLMDHSRGGLPDHTADHRPSQHGGADHGRPSRATAEPETAPTSVSAPANRSGEGTQLNVVI